MAMLVYQRVINNKDHAIFSDFVAAGGIANLGELCTDALITTYGLQRVAIVSWLHVIADFGTRNQTKPDSYWIHGKGGG